MKATFVIFHADRKAPEPAQEVASARGGTLTKFKNLDGYRQMIAMLVASIRRSNPGSRCVVLTDAHTERLDVLGADEVVRMDVDVQSLMLARMRAQIEYLSRPDLVGPVILLDSDMLVVQPIDAVFDGEFAVGVTHREDEPKMPYNGGIYFIQDGRLPRAVQFFERMLEIYLTKYGEYATWWGDQMALRDIVEESLAGDRATDVRVFPCAAFNFSPAYGSVYVDILREPLRASIWHFKGKRKRAMRIYSRAYLEESSASRLTARAALRVLAATEKLWSRRSRGQEE